MSLNKTTSSVSNVGNGVTDTFDFDFFIPSDSLAVYITENNIPRKLDPSEYVATGLDDANGGSVKLNVIPTSAQVVTIRREVPFTQPVSIEGNTFYPDVVVGALDRATMLIQQVLEEVGRAVQVPIGSDIDSSEYLEQAAASASLAEESATTATEAAASAAASEAAAAAYASSIDTGSFVQKDNNGSDFADVATVRTNLSIYSKAEIDAQDSGVDQAARDMAMVAYVKADIATSDPAGTYGPIMSDSFTSDTLAVSTNATYDAEGDYYHNPGSVGSVDVCTGGTATTDNGSYPERAFDNDTGTTWYTSEGGTETLPSYIQYDFGEGVSHAVAKVKITNSATGSYSPTAFTIQGSNDGVNFDVLDTQSGLSWAAGETKTFDFANVVKYRYMRLPASASSAAANWLQIAEIEMFALENPTDITLRPSAETLPTADPADVSIYFRVEDVDAVTEGVDRIVRVSIDGGTTWATASITDIGSYGGNDALIRADADVSAQSGDQFIWELTTANNKEQRIKHCAAVAGY